MLEEKCSTAFLPEHLFLFVMGASPSRARKSELSVSGSACSVFDCQGVSHHPHERELSVSRLACDILTIAYNSFKITSVIERGYIMARKESITIQMILDTAFEMTREEGFSNVTARKVATKAGCSTQPIFRLYKNMEELWDAVYDKAVFFFRDYCSLYPRVGKSPFSHLGMACIAFAREERHLFELLFVTEGSNKKTIYEVLNGGEGNLAYEMTLAKADGCLSPNDIFMRMWIFVHGAACMTLTGDYDLSDKETMELLEQTYKAFAGKN